MDVLEMYRGYDFLNYPEMRRLLEEKIDPFYYDEVPTGETVKVHIVPDFVKKIDLTKLSCLKRLAFRIKKIWARISYAFKRTFSFTFNDAFEKAASAINMQYLIQKEEVWAVVKKQEELRASQEELRRSRDLEEGCAQVRERVEEQRKEVIRISAELRGTEKELETVQQRIAKRERKIKEARAAIQEAERTKQQHLEPEEAATEPAWSLWNPFGANEENTTNVPEDVEQILKINRKTVEEEGNRLFDDRGQEASLEQKVRGLQEDKEGANKTLRSLKDELRRRKSSPPGSPPPGSPSTSSKLKKHTISSSLLGQEERA